MASAQIFDYLVIGAGSGGVASARRAAHWGKKVAICEAGRFGGTCVNVGCVPKKLCWNAGAIRDSIHSAHQYGITVSEMSFDWKLFKERRDKYIQRLNNIYKSNLEKDKVAIFKGVASFVKTVSENDVQIHTVKCGDDLIKARNVLIAVGGGPSKLDVAGAEFCIDSDGFFALETQPKKVAVIGAGYIAVELASALHELGSETLLFTRKDFPLRKFDKYIQENLLTELGRTGLKHVPNSVPKEVKMGSDNKRTIVLENGSAYTDFDVVLVAIGRAPCTTSLNVKAVGVETMKSGHIKVDDFQSTSVPGVYAVGDVCGKVELTPMAIRAGRRLADRLFSERQEFNSAKVDYELVPTVVFTHPPVGTVGLTEEAAKERYGADNLKIYTSTFVNLLYGVYDIEPKDKPKSYVKVICVKDKDELVVGLHMVGLTADEILQGFAVAISKGITKADLDNTLAIHPTAGEELVTLAPWGLRQD